MNECSHPKEKEQVKTIYCSKCGEYYSEVDYGERFEEIWNEGYEEAQEAYPKIEARTIERCAQWLESEGYYMTAAAMRRAMKKQP